MIDLLPLIEAPNLFTILLAPPAWGKTRLLLNIFRTTQKRIIYIAPLRALINEFSLVLKSEKIKCVNLGEDQDSKISLREIPSNHIILTTPERFFSFQCQTIIDHNTCVVLDELHLFFSWGECFRPILFEMLLLLGSQSVTLLGLSATLSSEVIDEIKHDFTLNYSKIYLIDLGNRRLKYQPNISFWYPSNISFCLKMFNRNIVKTVLKSTDVVLVFVYYRNQVDQWVDFLQRQGISAVGCKGGCVQAFIEQMKVTTPKCIVSTTSLSHGVNLPQISDIFLSYKVDDQDFWIQMVGRGGRNGSAFSLHHMNTLQFSTKQLIVSLFKTLLFSFFGWKMIK